MAQVNVYGLDRQGQGAFDGGRIVESKPIGFGNEGSEVRRIGPLFYWALATANEKGVIGLHPHRAFEIISFVIDGELGHYDTGGNELKLHYGDVQIMQTGSGISHEERFHEPGTSIFQIWFEPNLNKTIMDPAKYHYSSMNGEASKDSFVRELIGKNSVELEADTQVFHHRLQEGQSIDLTLEAVRAFAIVPFKGEISHDVNVVQEKDFLVIESDGETESISLSASEDSEFILVNVPLKVDYPLIRK